MKSIISAIRGKWHIALLGVAVYCAVILIVSVNSRNWMGASAMVVCVIADVVAAIWFVRQKRKWE